MALACGECDLRLVDGFRLSQRAMVAIWSCSCLRFVRSRASNSLFLATEKNNSQLAALMVRGHRSSLAHQPLHRLSDTDRFTTGRPWPTAILGVKFHRTLAIAGPTFLALLFATRITKRARKLQERINRFKLSRVSFPRR